MITKHLVLGGVKSGKSRYAMQLAMHHTSEEPTNEEVVFIATARAGDDEMAQRIERHRQDRPAHWRVLEEPRQLTECLQGISTRIADEQDSKKKPPIVLVDCLTLWLTQLCSEELSADQLSYECERLVQQVAEVNYPIILVSNELNMGVTPLGEFSRRFCDAAGLLHQSLATVCGSVTLVVAGLPMPLKSSFV